MPYTRVNIVEGASKIIALPSGFGVTGELKVNYSFINWCKVKGLLVPSFTSGIRHSIELGVAITFTIAH